MRACRYKSLKRHELAYIAGVMDGEGTLSLSTRNKYGSTQIVFNVANTDLALLKYLRKITGMGVIVVSNRPNNPKWKLGYNWRVCQGEARKLLPKLMPYLRVKKRQGRVLLRYLRVLDSTRVKTRARNVPIDAFILDIQKLNKKGR